MAVPAGQPEADVDVAVGLALHAIHDDADSETAFDHVETEGQVDPGQRFPRLAVTGLNVQRAMVSRAAAKRESKHKCGCGQSDAKCRALLAHPPNLSCQRRHAY